MTFRHLCGPSCLPHPHKGSQIQRAEGRVHVYVGPSLSESSPYNTIFMWGTTPSPISVHIKGEPPPTAPGVIHPLCPLAWSSPWWQWSIQGWVTYSDKWDIMRLLPGMLENWASQYTTTTTTTGLETEKRQVEQQQRISLKRVNIMGDQARKRKEMRTDDIIWLFSSSQPYPWTCQWCRPINSHFA